MLIDSGADTTLLPEAVVALLGITDTGERIPLMSFDGTISESKVARIDLVFGKGRFRGHYPLIDAEVGIVGRDVLNHLRLLLDAPAQQWDEKSTG